MKKIVFFVTAFMFCSSMLFAQQAVKLDMEVILGNRPPSANENRLLLMEERKHPNIAKSMHDIGDALKHLNEAPDDFGGHKGQAINDLKQGWVSLRKALYFRLYENRN